VSFHATVPGVLLADALQEPSRLPRVHVVHVDGAELIVLILLAILWFQWRTKSYTKKIYLQSREIGRGLAWIIQQIDKVKRGD
jgi:hypothetical protein